MNLIPTRNESDEPCREDAGLDGTEEVLSSQGTAHALHSVPAVSPCPQPAQGLSRCPAQRLPAHGLGWQGWLGKALGLLG